MLKFPLASLPWPLEEFLREVRQSPGQAVQMPLQLKWGGGPGAAASAVQALATWARIHPGLRELHLQRMFAEGADAQDKFASTLPGMAALYFCDRVQSGRHMLDRYAALQAVVPRVAAMQKGEFQNTLRGVGAALVCFAGAKNEFLKPLYARPEHGGVREQSDFRVLVPRMISQLGSGLASRLNDGQLDLISGLLHQLFLNTDEHGSYDVSGSVYPLAMRGISARLISLDTVLPMVEQAGNDTNTKAHLYKLSLLPVLGEAPDEKNKVRGGAVKLVELSVFDTGPGLGLRWLSERRGYESYSDFGEAEELEAVQTCFAKHATTKASQTSGLGLTMALMQMQRLKAFMTLRTGRLSLYQDFAKTTLTEFKPKPKFPRRRLSEVAGTSFSIWFRVA